jgi:hypothetical protein
VEVDSSSVEEDKDNVLNVRGTQALHSNYRPPYPKKIHKKEKPIHIQGRFFKRPNWDYDVQDLVVGSEEGGSKSVEDNGDSLYDLGEDSNESLDMDEMANSPEYRNKNFKKLQKNMKNRIISTRKTKKGRVNSTHKKTVQSTKSKFHFLAAALDAKRTKDSTEEVSADAADSNSNEATVNRAHFIPYY